MPTEKPPGIPLRESRGLSVITPVEIYVRIPVLKADVAVKFQPTVGKGEAESNGHSLERAATGCQ